MESQPEKQDFEIEIKHLKFGMSPRIEGQDVDHARALTFVLDQTPPILVDRRSRIVIDGIHRVSAARMLGRTVVRAHYFDGSSEDAFVEAVRSNIRHGKPLSLADREAAAKSVLKMCHEWSDRRIAEICGISDKTVGRIRSTTAEIPQSISRIGKDGRHRPASTVSNRDLGSQLLGPESSTINTDIAKPVSPTVSSASGLQSDLLDLNCDPPAQRNQATNGHKLGRSNSEGIDDRGRSCLWADDSAIGSIPGGGLLANWLDSTAICSTDWITQVDEIPISRVPQLIADARSRSEEWSAFAAALEIRCRKRNKQ